MSTALYSAYKRQEQLRLKRKREQLNAETRQFTRNNRQKISPIPNFTSLVNEVTNENVALSVRVKLALEMREKMFRLDVDEVVRLMTSHQHLIVKLADASLHTPYVPLQQLFFMSLTSLLSTLNDTRNERTTAVRQRFRENLRQLDKVLLSALPVDEVVEVINPMPLVVDEWLDFGGTALTIYHQLRHETILYNISYNSIEKLEFVEEACLGFIFTKHVAGLYGVNLIAFVVEPADFTVFMDTLTTISPDNTSIQVTPKPAPTRTISSNAVETIHLCGRPNIQVVQKNTMRSCMTSKNSVETTAANPSQHFSASVSVRLETRFTTSELPSTAGTIRKTPIPRAQMLNTMFHRACEEATRTINWTTPPEIATDANLTYQELVPTQIENNVLPVSDITTTVPSPRESNRLDTVSNTCTRPAVTPTRFSWIRTIQDQVRELLPNSDRAPLPDSSTDFLTSAKAECLKNLKESMGYVEEPEAVGMKFPRWLIFLIAVLVVVPWVLLMVQLCDFERCPDI